MEECYAAGAVQLSMADGTPPAGDLATSVACYWNDEDFFALFQAHFRTLRIIHTPVEKEDKGKTLHLWEQSDVLEVFIGQDARTLLRYGEFQVAPDGRWLDTLVRLDEGMILLHTAWDSGLLVSSALDDSRHLWRAAMQVPWRAFGAAGSPKQQHWDINFYRATGRFHGEELLAWSSTGYGEGCFHRPDRFGKLLLE
jgi:hypothetical protein